MITTDFNKNATLIYTNSWDDRVWMFKNIDHGTMRQSYGFVIQYADGAYSEIIERKRSQIIRGKNTFDFFFDYEGDFTRDDITAIKNAAMDEIKKSKPKIDFSTKYRIDHAYRLLVLYAHENQGDGEISISDGYCNFDTECFERVINDLELGYKKLEILRMLKLLELLRINKGRPYDWKLTDKNGTEYRAYRLKDIAEAELKAFSDNLDEGEGLAA